MKKEKSCGAVVIKKEKDEIKVLIIKQHDNCWHFPKGHVEKGETEEETAIREIKEETNIDVEIDNNFRKVITYSPKKGTIKDVVFFIGNATSFNLVIDPNELFEAKWVNAREVNKYLSYQDTIEVYEEAIEYLYDTGYFYDYYIPKDCKKIFIMLHGYSSNMYGSTNSYIKEQLKGTTTGYLLYDLPGHGFSPYNLSIKKCFETIDKANEFIDKRQKDIEKIILGMSFGGYLAVLESNRNPQKYSKIILRSPALKMYDCLYSFNKQAIDHQKLIIFGVPVTKGFVDELKNNDIFKMNIKINTNNVLIIHGDNDDAAPIKDAIAFTNSCGGSLKVIKGATHSFKLEHLKEMYDYIKEFIIKEDK